jgi:hypothetical protein
MSVESVASPQLWTDLTVIAGATLGNFARTMIPYWAKLKEMPELVFEKKFLGTAIISFLGALGIGLGLFPTLIETVPVNSMSLAGIFAIVALSAFGLNAGINWGIDQVTAPSAPGQTKSQESAP